jgi:hypothetical protein
MKLHTNVTEGTRGLLFKSKTWKMDSRIELSDEEAQLLRAHPEVGKMTIATGRFHDGSMEIECSVNMLVKGMTCVFRRFWTPIPTGCRTLIPIDVEHVIGA